MKSKTDYIGNYIKVIFGFALTVMCFKVDNLEKENKELKEKIQINKNNISRVFEQTSFTRDMLDGQYYELYKEVDKLKSEIKKIQEVK